MERCSRYHHDSFSVGESEKTWLRKEKVDAQAALERKSLHEWLQCEGIGCPRAFVEDGSDSLRSGHRRVYSYERIYEQNWNALYHTYFECPISHSAMHSAALPFEVYGLQFE